MASSSPTTGRTSAATTLPTPLAGRPRYTRADYRYARHSGVFARSRRGLRARADRGPPDVGEAEGRNAFAVRREPAQVVAISRRSLAFGSMPSTTTIYGNHTQVSPRLNLRYDFDDQWRLYGSAGRFTQAQHVEEWRVEEAQQAPDSAQVSIHTILGLEHDTAGGMRLGHRGVHQALDHQCAVFRQSTRSVRAAARPDARSHTRRSERRPKRAGSR